MNMKKCVLLVAGLALLTGSAMAGDNIGSITQALGEQCSVVTNVVQDNGGGCGSSSSYVDVTFVIGVQAYKDYVLKASYIDWNDNQTQLSLTGEDVTTSGNEIHLMTSSSRNVSLDTSYSADPGKYQIKLSVLNADTGAEVCAASGMVDVK